MKEYYSRLKTSYEMGRKTIFADEESIERFDQAIKYYYNDSMSSYSRSVKKRESTEGGGKEEQGDFIRI